MPLSRAQQILLKRAQHQAGIADAEYREHLSTCTGLPACRSSKDPRLIDAHLDAIMSFFEATYWRKVESGSSVHVFKPSSPFRERGFWSARNERGNTSRDRFSQADLARRIAALESDLDALGCGPSYCAAIRRRLPANADWQYLGALQRTLKSKSRQPF